MTRSASASTYDDDFFAWTQEQAAALRGLPRDVVGDAVDVEHVAEEIEDLGKRDLREVNSFLARLCEHLMKVNASPRSRNLAHWRSEALSFQFSASDAYSASMRQLIDMPRVWRRGRKLAQISLDERSRSSLGQGECPFALDELLSDDFDLDAAVAKLAATSRPDGA